MSYKVKMLTSEIIHLQFPNNRAMKKHLMRFQLYAEHPVFKKKIFSKKEYINWYLSIYGGKASDVYDIWLGCNIPHTAFKPFWEGAFKTMSREENRVLKTLSCLRGKRFYLIASADGDLGVMKHELAHAFFGTNADYRKKAKNIVFRLSDEARKVIKERLYYCDYDKSTILDETHAFLLDGLKSFNSVFVCGEPKMPKPVEAEFVKISKDIRVLFKATVQNSGLSLEG